MIRIGTVVFLIFANSINLFAQGASVIRFSKDTVHENGFYGQYSRDSVLLRNEFPYSITIDSISLYCDTSSYLRVGNSSRSPRYAVGFKVNQLSNMFEYESIDGQRHTFPNPVNSFTQAIPAIQKDSSLVIKDFTLAPCFMCPTSETALIDNLPDTVLIHIVFKNKNNLNTRDSLSLIGILEPSTNIIKNQKMTSYPSKYDKRKGAETYSLEGRRTKNQSKTKPVRLEIIKNDGYQKKLTRSFNH